VDSNRIGGFSAEDWDGNLPETENDIEDQNMQYGDRSVHGGFGLNYSWWTPFENTEETFPVLKNDVQEEPSSLPKAEINQEKGHLLELQDSLKSAANANLEYSLALCHPKDQGQYPRVVEWLQSRVPQGTIVRQSPGAEIILDCPDKALDQALGILENLTRQWHQEGDEFSWELKFGVSSRSGRLLGVEKLLSEARIALDRCQDSSESVLGFITDAERYRRYLAQNA